MSGLTIFGASPGSSVSDAATGTKGIVQLAGDLAGTAAAPTVPALATLSTAIGALNTSVAGKNATLTAPGDVPGLTTALAAKLDATSHPYVDRGAWAATTAYALGDSVTRPNGLRWLRKTAGTSAASFVLDSANWIQLGNGTIYSEVLTSESTASTTYVDLATVGPSVTLDVPTNGLVQLYAEAEILGDGTNLARVALVDTVDFAANAQLILTRSTASFAVMRAQPSSTNGTSARISAFLTFAATAGPVTYTLRYSVAAGAGGSFRNRKLWARVV